MKIIGIIFSVIVTLVSASEWIDPHDMNTNAKEKYVKQTFKKSQSTLSVNDGIADPCPDICHSYLRRIVGILIKSAYIDKRNSESYHGHIRFNIKPSHFDFLNDFGKEVVTLDKLRQLDRILSENFKRTFVNEYLYTIESFWLQLYSATIRIENLWMLGGVFLLYVVYQQLRYGFSFLYILKYLFTIILTVDFGLRYQHLLQEAEEHNMGVVYSKECDPSQMSWAEFIGFMLTTRNCEKKTVTPLDAFLYQIKHIIVIPMHALGTGMGGFGTNMFSNLPWGLNLIMWPVMLVFCLLCFLFVITICTGQSIELNIFHLFKMKFGGDHKGNSLTDPTVEKILDKALHRPMVQNVHISVPTSDGPKKSASLPQISSTNESSTSDNPADNPQKILVDSKSSVKSTKSCDTKTGWRQIVKRKKSNNSTTVK